MTTLQLVSLRIQLDPAGPSRSSIDMKLTTGNPWPIASGIEIEHVGFMLSIRPNTSPMLRAIVFGTLKVPPLSLSASIPMPLMGSIHIDGRTSQPLPGFRALAKLVDADFAASLPDGVANLGSLRIDRMWLDYDLDASAVSSLGISIASNGPWTLIPKYLELDHLAFQVAATKLTSGWSIQGMASGTILIVNTRVSLVIQGGAGAWGIALTEPLYLPSVEDLVNLIGGSDGPNVLPAGFGGGVGALTVYAYSISFGGATNALQSLALSFGTPNPWPFWDPYFVLKSLNVAIDVEGPAGGTRTLAAAIHGEIEVGGVDLVLSAQHPSTGTSWTFGGGLAPDQELAIRDFIGHLLSKFKVNAPTAITSFELTQLDLTFETGTRIFTYQSAGSCVVADETVEMTLDFSVMPGVTAPAAPSDQALPARQDGPTTTGFALDVVGTLTIGTSNFTATFDKTPSQATFTAH